MLSNVRGALVCRQGSIGRLSALVTHLDEGGTQGREGGREGLVDVRTFQCSSLQGIQEERG